MGIVDSFFVHSFSTKRFNGGSTTTVIASEKGLITKVQDDAQQLAAGLFGKTYRLYCPRGLDIKETDIVASGGINYQVKGVDDDIPDMFEGTDNFSVYLITKANQ